MEVRTKSAKVDRRHGNPVVFARFRERCLGYTAQKAWVETEKQP